MEQINRLIINGKEYSIDGDNAFIRFSDARDGTDFTEDWREGQNYVGFATGQEAPTDKAGYVWVSLGITEANEATSRANEAIASANEATLKANEATSKVEDAVNRAEASADKIDEAVETVAKETAERVEEALGITFTDDKEGNVTIIATVGLTCIDDGNGNINIMLGGA